MKKRIRKPDGKGKNVTKLLVAMTGKGGWATLCLPMKGSRSIAGERIPSADQTREIHAEMGWVPHPLVCKGAGFKVQSVAELGGRRKVKTILLKCL